MLAFEIFVQGSKLFPFSHHNQLCSVAPNWLLILRIYLAQLLSLKLTSREKKQGSLKELTRFYICSLCFPGVRMEQQQNSTQQIRKSFSKFILEKECRAYVHVCFNDCQTLLV